MSRDKVQPVVLLTVISLAAFLAIVDGTIVALTLPAIAHDLGGDIVGLAWIPNAYVLTYAVLLGSAGTLGDRLGHRPVFLAGIALFAAGSVACATSGSLGWLILGRVVQGAGAAAMLTLALAHISVAFPDRREWAMGIYVIFGSLGGVAGPLVGGAVTQFGSWRLMFWILAAIAGISLGLAWITVADSPAAPRRLDLIGLLLVGATVLGLNTFLLNGSGWGWLSSRTLGSAVVGVAAAGALVAWEARSPAPILNLRQFARRDFLANTLASAAGWFAIFAVDVYTSLYLQKVLGLGAVTAGLALAAGGLTGGLTGFTVGRAAARFGRDRLLVSSMVAMSVLLIPWIGVTPRWPLWSMVVLLGALGVPFTYVLALSAAGAMGDLPDGQAGVGAATFNTVRQIGSSMGIALPAAVLASAAGAGAVEISSSALQGAFAAAFLVRACAFALASAAVSVVLLWPRTPAATFPTPPGAGKPLPPMNKEDSVENLNCEDAGRRMTPVASGLRKT
ncbi:MAG: DHA2 family efflux MFS transporter permease subunit [Candidatus Dormibacteraceae bacterium]